MSVLSFPRFYLCGTMSWDPIVSNNASDDYDPVTGQVRLEPGETTADFRRRMIITTVGRGDWNYFGTNRCALQAKVVGAAAAPHNRDVEQDALLKAPVELVGKLVDIDPTGACSQIYFDELTLGSPGHPHLRARPRRRMSSRWLNRTRNRATLPIAGSAAAAWQTVFPAAEIEIMRAEQSPLLATLQQALGDPNVRGLMLRLCTYRTRYFGGRLQTSDKQRALLAELRRLQQQGIPTSNPAESLVVGALGVWSDGNSESVPGGRQLIAAGSPPVVVGTAPLMLGPAAAELHPDTRVLSLDLSNTIPEEDSNLAKVNLGPLTVSVTADGNRSEVGRIEVSGYSRAAYEACAGIVDLDLPPALDLALFARGRLSLEMQTQGGPTVLSAERQLTASCDDCNVYLDEGEARTLVIRVRERGEVPTRPISLLVASYDADMSLAGEPIELPVRPDGTAQLKIRGATPGFRHLSFLAFTGPRPTPPPRLGLGTGQFTSVRTLPFDDALEAATADQALTWEFVYANVLQTYDAIAPRMSVILDLGDRDAVQTFARRLKDVTAAELFESSRYMPVTRDLSRGKRILLQRFCDLALAGTLPAAQPQPTRPVIPDQAPDASQPATREQPADVLAAERFEKRALPPP
jgi:hypothetical protein